MLVLMPVEVPDDAELVGVVVYGRQSGREMLLLLRPKGSATTELEVAKAVQRLLPTLEFLADPPRGGVM